jgi:hypothetical protein
MFGVAARFGAGVAPGRYGMVLMCLAIETEVFLL